MPDITEFLTTKIHSPAVTQSLKGGHGSYLGSITELATEIGKIKVKIPFPRGWNYKLTCTDGIVTITFPKGLLRLVVEHSPMAGQPVLCN